MEISKIEIFKDGDLVATCFKGIKLLFFESEELPPATVYNLPVIELDRKKVFEHLNGRPLSSFLNRSGIRIHHSKDDTQIQEIEPIFYIHGRSETVRGTTKVTAVILMLFHCSEEQLPRQRDLISMTPRLYREISKLI